MGGGAVFDMSPPPPLTGLEVWTTPSSHQAIKPANCRNNNNDMLRRQPRATPVTPATYTTRTRRHYCTTTAYKHNSSHALHRVCDNQTAHDIARRI